MRQFETKVTLKTILKDTKSDSAIKEAVANAIDANSKNIYIEVYEKTISNDIMDTICICLDIADDGDGIVTKERKFEDAFCQYNVSIKNEKVKYGKKGKGRYSYLSLVKNHKNLNIYTKNTQVFKIAFSCKSNENITLKLENYNKKIDTQIKQNYTTLVQFYDLNEEKFNIKKEIKRKFQKRLKVK